MTSLPGPTTPTTMSPPPTTDLAAVAEAIRRHDRFLLVTHENPDGDALGSILGAKLALDRLGKDSVMYLGGDTDPPAEYAFLALDELRRELPDGRRRARAARARLRERAADGRRRRAARRGAAVDRRRPPPRQHALRHDQPRRRGRVVDGRDRPRPPARARRPADARDRRSALRRARHRHRAASSTRTRRRRRSGSRPSSSRRASTSTASSRASTSRSSSRSSSCSRARSSALRSTTAAGS